jgi:hypothetical protein
MTDKELDITADRITARIERTADLLLRQQAAECHGLYGLADLWAAKIEKVKAEMAEIMLSIPADKRANFLRGKAHLN